MMQAKYYRFYLATVLSVFAFTPLSYAQWWNPFAKSIMPNCPTDKSARFHNCFGEISFPDGTRYIGEFKDDTFHGRGLGIKPDGSRYSGEYASGMRNGQGIEYNSDKSVRRSGKWRNGDFISAAKLDTSNFSFSTSKDDLTRKDAEQSNNSPSASEISKNNELEFLNSLPKKLRYAGLLQYNVFWEPNGSDTLSLPEYRRLCSITERNNNVTYAGIATCFSVFDEAYNFIREGGSSVIQSYKVYWDEGGQRCRLKVTVGGVKNGSSFGRSTSCQVRGFFIKDDGEVLASSSSDISR